jgi:dolichol-phosphate mannosyltransferase
LTVVIPTLDERGNITPFRKLLDAALSGITSEVIFVDDDSPDGTADLIRAIGKLDCRVRCLQRIRSGLSSACIEGALPPVTPVVAVIDADFSTTKPRCHACSNVCAAAIAISWSAAAMCRAAVSAI